jgi:geranylgeranyl pyrophosphate synthase
MKISFYINLILSLENSSILTEEQSESLDGFDTAILMLDDIQDKSQTRNGEKCFYLIHGVDKTKKHAKVLHNKAFKTLSSICQKRKVGLLNTLKAKLLLNVLYFKILKGQRIDYLLEQTTNVEKISESKYFEMITLFTGGHIKYAFLLGYLLANKKPKYKPSVVSIGEKIGILRQIFDDISDYKKGHHEPLGDLINSKKRLPELFFRLSSKKDIFILEKLLENPHDNFIKIYELVFNEEVRILLKEKIEFYKKGIDNDLQKLPYQYQKELNNLLYKFYNVDF